MLAPDGSINENGAPFTGMMRYDARIAVEAALQEKVSHPPRSLLLS
jgi:valyl-tRNA synthetase